VVDLVVNWRLGAVYSGEALAIVESGEWMRTDRRDGFSLVVAMESADDFGLSWNSWKLP